MMTVNLTHSEASPPGMLATYLLSGLSTQIATWLEDEWRAPQLEEVHRGIGNAAAAAYVRARAQGLNEVGDILLAVSTSLLDHDFNECGCGGEGGGGRGLKICCESMMLWAAEISFWPRLTRGMACRFMLAWTA